MNITLRHLRKSYGAERPVVNDVSFEIPAGEIFGLVGPSGCGKTTLLRMLAGFVRPDEGEILFGGWRMNEVPPQKRRTALVFQHYAIWPHLTVYDNIAYGPRAQGSAVHAEVDRRVRRALDITRLGELAQRKPAQLSGGQQQRVALARALAAEPEVILFDEPLSSLDARLRLELRDELRRIQRETRLTCLYVTHDQEEALSLSDRLGVMNAGRLEQVGRPEDIYHRPTNEFVGRFMGEINLLPPGGPWRAAMNLPGNDIVAFRPEAARLSDSGIPVTVQTSRFLGSKTEIEVAGDDPSAPLLKLWVPEPLSPGAFTRFEISAGALIRFPVAP